MRLQRSGGLVCASLPTGFDDDDMLAQRRAGLCHGGAAPVAGRDWLVECPLVFLFEVVIDFAHRFLIAWGAGGLV